jgi:hypothetical protein
MLELLAETWPEGWSSLAKFRIMCRRERGEVEHALRRAVEESPLKKEALLARAQYAVNTRDFDTWIADRISATELDPADVKLLSTVAGDFIRYLSHAGETLPPKRRRIYLASLRAQMAKNVKALNADGLSRLAWLHYHEGEKRTAAEYAVSGFEKDRRNEHCERLLLRLEAEGVRISSPEWQRRKSWRF